MPHTQPRPILARDPDRLIACTDHPVRLAREVPRRAEPVSSVYPLRFQAVHILPRIVCIQIRDG